LDCALNFSFGKLLLLALAQQQLPDLREAARLDQAGRCAESEAIYQRALAQGAPGPALLNNTGNHYLVCGAPEKARAYFERLVKAVPAHGNGNLQLARMDMAAGAFARAEERLTKLAGTGGDFDLLFLLGRVAARAGHAAKAREALEAALRLKDGDTAVMREAGLANAAAGDYPRAVFLLARAQSAAPNDPGIALALARASEDAGYYGDSVIAYDRYLALAPEDAGARRDRARVKAWTVNGSALDLEEYVAKAQATPWAISTWRRCDGRRMPMGRWRAWPRQWRLIRGCRRRMSRAPGCCTGWAATRRLLRIWNGGRTMCARWI